MIKYNGVKVTVIRWIIKGAHDNVNGKTVVRDWVQVENEKGSRFPVSTDELSGGSLKEILKKLPKLSSEETKE